MNFNEMYEVVKGEFGEKVAICTVIACSVCLTTKPKAKDFYTKGSYTKRVNYKTQKALWEYEQRCVDLAIKIRDVINIYNLLIDMKGLGGSRVKTLKELINEST